ncbi:MAG: VCBS repeat-containing protein [Gammaproteobacteria bacterium]|nr:VCBS repeat-containing protein [Gammaproteobacteria bacterium]NNM14013.1 VCBS repeat-containing protein [Gammaproteobacteria bacterium]
MLEIIFLIFAASTSLEPMYTLDLSAGENSLHAADVNRDGHIDVIVANQNDHSVKIYHGDSTGKLSPGKSYAAGHDPSDIVSDDFNQDGYLDLVVANHDMNYLSVLYGSKSGGLEMSKQQIKLSVEPHPHVLEYFDIDNDGNKDLLVDNRFNNGVQVLKANESGQFHSRGILINTGGDPYLGFAVIDINQDGLADLISPNTNNIGIAINQSDKKIRFAKPYFLSDIEPFGLTVLDIDADGNLDIVAVTESSKQAIAIYHGRSDNTFATEPEWISMAAGPKNIVQGDLNGDAINDVLVTAWNSDSKIIFGGAKERKTSKPNLGKLDSPWGALIVDLNADSVGDYIISDGESRIANVYLSETESD